MSVVLHSVKNKPKVNEDPKNVKLRELKEALDKQRSQALVCTFHCRS